MQAPTYKQRKYYFTLITVTTLWLSGCGGSDSSGTTNTVTKTNTVTETRTITQTVPAETNATSAIDGHAVDGYLVNAKVCIDRNENARCDHGEPYTMTEPGGTYHLEVNQTDLRTYPMVAEVIAGTTYDEDDGADKPLNTSFNIVAPKNAQYIISSLTTLVHETMKQGYSFSNAKQLVAQMLGISEDNLFTNYVEENNTQVAAVSKKAFIRQADSDGNATRVYHYYKSLIAASDVNYGTPIGSTSATLNWVTESNASSALGESLSVLEITQGSKGITTVSGTQMSYTPDSNQSGSDSVKLKIGDSSGHSKTITVTLNEIETRNLYISLSSPQDGTTDAASNLKNITLFFSKTLDASNITNADISLKDSTGTRIQGTPSVLSSTLVYTLSSDNALTADTTYTFTLPDTIKDSSGNALSGGYTLTFKTGSNQDTTAPRLTSITPANNETNVSIQSSIILYFSEAIDPASAQKITLTNESNSSTIPVTITFSDNKTLSLKPEKLFSDTTYQLKAETVTDLSGNQLASDQTSRFTTKNNFYLADNGTTIKCQGAAVGDTGTVNRKTYKAVDNTLIKLADQSSEDFSLFCTTHVTDMSALFMNNRTFNQDISSWDTSNVRFMHAMFVFSDAFNQNISKWDTSSVLSMSAMFTSAASFNQDLSGWNVSKVTNPANNEGYINFAAGIDPAINTTYKAPVWP